jgi:hypothetical protein
VPLTITFGAVTLDARVIYSAWLAEELTKNPHPDVVRLELPLSERACGAVASST